MGMPAHVEGGTGRRWSTQEVRSLPADGHRYEVVDGVLLVTPAPTYGHQAIVGALYRTLHAWVSAHQLGVVLFAPADVVVDSHTLLQPDLLVLPPVGRAVMEGETMAPLPMLVIEVLSPGTARQDRLRKRPKLQDIGIECWLVDPVSELVERWTPDAHRPEICTDLVRWVPATRPDLVLEVAVSPLWGAAEGTLAQ